VKLQYCSTRYHLSRGVNESLSRSLRVTKQGCIYGTPILYQRLLLDSCIVYNCGIPIKKILGYQRNFLEDQYSSYLGLPPTVYLHNVWHMPIMDTIYNPYIWPGWNWGKIISAQKLNMFNSYCASSCLCCAELLLNLFIHCLHLCIYMGMHIWAVPYIYAVHTYGAVYMEYVCGNPTSVFFMCRYPHQSRNNNMFLI
jgi:hypothetical protein